MTNPADAAVLERLTDLIAKARAAGADAADAVRIDGTSLSMACRLGETETVERSEGQDLGLRVFVGRRQACVSSSDFSDTALDELVARAVAMAKAVPEDPYCGLADPDQLATGTVDLDMNDPTDSTPDGLAALAAAAEDAARAVPGVTNSEGAEASWSRTRVAIAASNGFARIYARTSHGLSASVLAGEGTGMERDYDYDATVFAEDLRPDVCLLDIRMPELDGIEATRLLAGPDVTDPLAVVVITTFDLDEYVHGALKAGARGFLLKDAGPDLLAQAVRAAANGDALIAPSVTARLLSTFSGLGDSTREPAAQPIAPLTEREEEVLVTVALGRTNAEIADVLCISLSTVKTHLASLMNKLGARNRVELAMWAYETDRVPK